MELFICSKQQAKLEKMILLFFFFHFVTIFKRKKGIRDVHEHG